MKEKRDSDESVSQGRRESTSAERGQRESNEQSQGRWNCDLFPGTGTPIQMKDE